jgi:hypothetical protein
MPDSDPCAFTALFVREFEQGAGNPQAKPGKRVPWTVPLFRRALSTRLSNNTTLNVTEFSDDAIRTWLNGRSIPRLPTMQLIAEVFYADNEAAQDAIAETWRASQGSKAKRASAPAEPARAPIWAQDPTPPITGIIALTIREPDLENDPARPGWRVSGRLLTGEGDLETTMLNTETQHEEPVYLRIGLKPGLLLAVEGSGGVQPDMPTPRADAALPAHVEPAPGGWKVTGPIKGGLLAGTAFDGLTLAHIHHWPESAAASLTFTIAATGPLLKVVELDEDGAVKPETAPSHTKSVLLDLVLKEALAGRGRTLQRVTLTRMLPK